MNQPQVTKVELTDKNSEIINCGKCGGELFDQVFRVRRMSAIISPTGQELFAPDSLLRCVDCGRARKLQKIHKKEPEGKH